MEPNLNQLKTLKFTPKHKLHNGLTHMAFVDLQKNLISKYTLGIEYGEDEEGHTNVPVSAYSSTSGFIIATNWKPGSIIINRTNENNTFTYSVNGVVEWKLFGGATIYTQRKNFEGTMEVE
jgi:hypothetical protein